MWCTHEHVNEPQDSIFFEENDDKSYKPEHVSHAVLFDSDLATVVVDQFQRHKADSSQFEHIVVDEAVCVHLVACSIQCLSLFSSTSNQLYVLCVFNSV